LSDPSLEFLWEGLNAIPDKDSMASCASRMKEYVPSTSTSSSLGRKRKLSGSKPPMTVTGGSGTSASTTTTTKEKRAKGTTRNDATSEALLADPYGVGVSLNPLEKAIEEAAAGTEGRTSDEIVPDDDDYD
jgi:hypothetical protein